MDPIFGQNKAASTPGAAFLRIHDAVVRRNGVDILAIQDLILGEGESMAILGPNGSGKSTFISLITREALPLYREEPPVLFRGQPRAVLSDIRRALGIVSATMQREISVHLPVRDIVAGGATGTLGLPFHVNEDRANQAREAAAGPMELLGISDLADRDVMTLSTGQARRVLIARSLISDPDVMVFDEPTTGLDPEGMYYVREALSTLARSGKGIILVTHYPEDIIPEIERILLLKEGRVFADGPKEQLLTNERMSDLFDVPLRVVHENGRYLLY